MLSLQVKSLPKEYFLMILSVLDDFTLSENPPEKHLLIKLSVLDDFTLSENPPEKAYTYKTFDLG